MRILIVDDDPSVTLAIKTLCTSKEIGIDEAISFTSSVDAYEYIEKNTVDILITDIKMPMYNGLQLSEELMKRNPDAKIIVLTSYSEFEYAHTAIKIGVVDYFLKPFSNAEMLASIEKAVRTINYNREIVRFWQKNKFDGNEVFEIEKKLFFLNIDNECSVLQEKIREKLKRFGVYKQQSTYVTVIISITKIESLYYNINEYDYAFLNYKIDEILNKKIEGQYFSGIYNDSVALVIFLNENTTEKLIRSCMNELPNTAELIYRVAVGKQNSEIENINESFAQTKYIHNQMGFFNADGIALYGEFTPKYIYPEDLENELFKRLQDTSDSTIGLNGLVVDYFGALMWRKVDKDLLTENCCKLLSALSKRIYAIGISDVGKYDFVYWIKQSRNINNVKELERFVINGLELIRMEISKAKLLKNDYKVEIIKNYINEHLNADISLINLARKVDLSPGYLAVLFKEKIGQNYSEYVTAQRIQKAKHLLANTGKKVGEISKLVGYDNQRYFSELFKQHTGMQPSEFRKKQS